VAKVLNTSAVTFFMEEMIKNASDRLILISPFLKLNQRVQELLEDRNRLKIDIRLVYGKNDLQNEQIDWLKHREFIRTSFCQHLHAKLYLSESMCIVTSMNLYEFSQVNNNEIGVLIERESDPELYREAYDEAQRLVRISEEVKLSVERINKPESQQEKAPASAAPGEKVTTSALAKQLKMKTKELLEILVKMDLLKDMGAGKRHLTQAGHDIGAEFRRGRKGYYFLWPTSLAGQIAKERAA
jgi:hypothetical protein